MKKNLTEIVFILDESGSMCNLISDTIGGFNSLIEKQKKEANEALVSTVLFSTASKVIHDRVPIEQISQMTEKDYCPGGSTALFDAVGNAVHHIGNIHKYARREDIPEHTIFVITTDGMENASRFYSREKVKQMILRQQERYGWEFIFLGANIDSSETAESIGISKDTAVNYCADAEGTSMLYCAMSAAVSSVRNGKRLASSSDWRRKLDQEDIKRKSI